MASRDIRLAPFEVTTEPAAVAAYAAASRFVGEGAPLAFPMAWLARDPVRAAVLSLAEPGEVAFHEDQSFEALAPLSAGATYRLSARVERREEPARIVVRAEVADAAGAILTRMETGLRLVRADAPRAAGPVVQSAQQ